jgi:hypothetical protein
LESLDKLSVRKAKYLYMAGRTGGDKEWQSPIDVAAMLRMANAYSLAGAIEGVIWFCGWDAQAPDEKKSEKWEDDINGQWAIELLRQY